MIHILFRGIFILLLMYSGMLGHWGTVVMNTIVFFVTIPLIYLGKKDPRYLHVDSFLMALFGMGIVAGHAGWMTTSSPLLGVDTLLHAIGGFAIGWLGIIFYDGKIKNHFVKHLTIIFAVLAIGAGWEIFEYFLWILPPHVWHAGLADTMLDLIADTIGGIIAVIFSASGRSVFKGRKRK